jgi:2-amino-4-hydroxy-6-hydroxymethyldihydropteridine diphosphokinase
MMPPGTPADKPAAAESREMNRAYLSLGSNIEPDRYLPAAVEFLGRYGRVSAASTVWETRPLGSAEQANFLNAVVLLETGLSAQDLREEAIPAIEAELGRVRTADKKAARTIDLDIMLFNEAVMQLGRRRIPDPEILERPFVAIPLAEIAPEYVHPETGQTLRAIAARFDPVASGMKKREDVLLRGGPLPYH